MDEKKELIEGYSELPLGEKRKELGREIAELTMITEKLMTDIDPNYKTKSVDEFTNLFEESTPEDEYLTGLYQDVIELEESVGDYYDIITDIYYEDSSSGEYENMEPMNKLGLEGFTKLGILMLITIILIVGIFALYFLFR